MDSPVLPGAGSTSPISPVPVPLRSGAANGGPKRKRSETGLVHSIESSPGSVGDENDLPEHHDKRRQPGVKRACNECRQQKLRCDVVQDPFASCSRCRRLKLDCKIESNFKRVGKRSRHAEMEREIDRLRRLVQSAQTQGFLVPEDEDESHSQLQSPVVHSYSHTRNPSLMGSDEAVSSLLHLKRGGSYHIPRVVRELDDFKVTEDMEAHFFQEFFANYHQFLPFLNEYQSPERYYQQHPLLYWAIISVSCRRYQDPTLLQQLAGPLHKLIWATIGDVPQSYYVVQALCLICTWPVPTSISTLDPTHILCGVMMKVATGIGLHRPKHIQDFSRIPVELNMEGLHDRVKTWAVCNIVAQTIGTGYGQPASSLYDWTLAVRPGDSGPFSLGPELEARLQIERFCDKVSKEMYSSASDPRGVAGDDHRAMLMRVYRRDYNELQAAILSQKLSPVVGLHLRAAALHLRLAGFFDGSSTPGYMDDLMGMWRATCSFLDFILDGDTESEEIGPADFLLRYATNYIQKMLVAAGFALLKLIRSFFVNVVNNDLNWRLAELMVQIWNGARLDAAGQTHSNEDGSPESIDNSLQLKVRCRHSMSLVFDLIWHWREEYQARGRGTLDPSSTHLDSALMPASQGLPTTLAGLASSNGALTPSGGSVMGGGVGGQGNALLGMAYESSYDVWDPQHWMLDGLLDFNYTYVPPLETA
ncbi:hypothetical protein P8C59_008088 [Phyllachora maydis]|uniref:Zn(2)-C6 fungal-type domain-containing protein n=1 Tax=Phyllachora maydis TaxID=1825666 RepID=A0AAD9IA01_9PEZI|nr:hypothetical protein P8C59_008088 [Phyllachora maydis]